MKPGRKLRGSVGGAKEVVLLLAEISYQVVKGARQVRWRVLRLNPWLGGVLPPPRRSLTSSVPVLYRPASAPPCPRMSRRARAGTSGR